MCGLVGFITNEKNKKKTIKKMSDLIKHRGPDSETYYIDDYIAIGFRRLSIIDIESGDQPIFNESKDKLIVFNGEIYNYQSLRKNLIKKGHTFKTNTDTEVVIHGYEEYGEKILNKLRGMFSFVIYDLNDKSLFCARDFYGIKPFYYYFNNNCFLFGSEIKSFLGNPYFKKELNEDLLSIYLTFQYSPTNETFFKNVYKLKPGHYLVYKNDKIKIKKYYEVTFDKIDDINKEKELENLLDKVIDYHQISDTEVGAFLSSGVDSSFIVSKSKINKTFTVGYENKKISELEYAKKFAKHMKVVNEGKIITKKEFFKVFDKVQYYMDEPLADASSVSLYLLSKLASKKVKVCLSGEGADEIFGGYNIYAENAELNWYYKVPFFIRRALRNIFLPFRNMKGFNFIIRRGEKLEERYTGNSFIFNENEIKKLLNKKINRTYKDVTKPLFEKCKEYDDISKMQFIDFNTWFANDIFLKADKMSMAHSLEVRVPFSDKNIVDLATTLSTDYKVHKNKTKILFRKIAKKSIPSQVANKKKLGFPVPLREWLKEEDIYKVIKEEFLNNTFFNKKYIIKLLDDHKNNRHDNYRKIWTIYTFLVWHKQYFK